MKSKGLKSVACVILFSFGLVSFSGCVSAPRFADYADLDKEDALLALHNKKVSKGVKLGFCWVWGLFTFGIAPIVETIKVITFSDDFKTVERRIREEEPSSVKVTVTSSTL